MAPVCADWSNCAVFCVQLLCKQAALQQHRQLLQVVLLSAVDLLEHGES